MHPNLDVKSDQFLGSTLQLLPDSCDRSYPIGNSAEAGHDTVAGARASAPFSRRRLTKVGAPTAMPSMSRARLRSVGRRTARAHGKGGVVVVSQNDFVMKIYDFRDFHMKIYDFPW